MFGEYWQTIICFVPKSFCNSLDASVARRGEDVDVTYSGTEFDSEVEGGGPNDFSDDVI